MKRLIQFLSKFTEDFFILIGIYFITKAGFLVYTPLGYLILGVFFMALGLSMLRRR